MRVVVDTNVVVSHYITPAAHAARVLLAWQAQRFNLTVPEPILGEIERVLGYPHLHARHQMEAAEIARVIDEFRNLAVLVEPVDVPNVVNDDTDDNKFLACAIAGSADVIVSGDRHLLALGGYEGIPIMTPVAFLLHLEQEERDPAVRHALTIDGQYLPSATMDHRRHRRGIPE